MVTLTELDRRHLAKLLLGKENFLVFIEKHQGYFRTIYNVQPKLGFTAGVLRVSKGAAVGSIVTIDSSIKSYNNSDHDGVETFTLTEIPNAIYGQSNIRYEGIPADNIMCLFKRLPTQLVEGTLERSHEEDEEEYHFDL